MNRPPLSAPAVALLCGLAACSAPPRPAGVTGAEMCASCRMTVSDVHFAAQIVAPGEEPRFFDDIGCLARALKADPSAPGAVAFVADHRTGEWIRASEAVYTSTTRVATPMGSGIVAHANAASRDADAAAHGGEPRTPADLFGAGGPPGGRDGG